jgi:hypothetical protein
MASLSHRTAALPLATLALGALAADAGAAIYVAQPDGGGRIELEAKRGHLLRADASLPAHCENNHGGTWRDDVGMSLSGDLAFQSGRFHIQGEAPNGVKYDFRGRRRKGAISGRLRMTYLDLDFVGVDDSYLCDTGMTRYRAARR